MASDLSLPSDRTQGSSPDVSLRLHAEEVSVSKRRAVSGKVRVKVTSRSRDQVIDEALSHERVVVERVTVNRPVETVPPLRMEGDITVLSVIEEVVVVTRQLILKEEIRMRRVHVTEAHHEVVTLREQEAVVTRVAADTGISESAGSLLTSHPQPAAQEDDA